MSTINIFNAKVCKAYRTGALAIPDSVETYLQFQAAEPNDDDMWTASAPGRITILYAGLYLLLANVLYVPDAVGQRHVTLRVNGTEVEVATFAPSNTGFGNGAVAMSLLTLEKNDYVEVSTYQNSGQPAGLNLRVLQEKVPFLSALLIRSADQALTVIQPVEVGDQTRLTLVRGDDYAAADGRALQFTADDWPNLTGLSEAKLTARHRSADMKLFEKTDLVSARILGSGTQKLVFELTPAQTGTLPPTPFKKLAANEVKFDVQAIVSDRILTLVRGTVDVVEDQTRPA
jgi:hypothetical protein